MRDETDLGGLKLALDLKRGKDPEKLMAKLFRTTPLEDVFSCNFNVLIAGQPRVMGVREILTEWSAFRTDCVRRRVYFDLNGKQKRLHLLRGLEAIVLDIDKAIRIVRETTEDAEVVPNLMIGFGIDREQGEYVAEIKLRYLNREYILKRTEEIAALEKDIAELKSVLADPHKVQKIIIDELTEIEKKYAQPRRSEILYDAPEEADEEESQELPDYPVTVFYTEEGYFKKITPASLRMSSEQRLKEGDAVRYEIETKNNAWLLFFTNKAQVYKARVGDFADTKASVMGEYLPAKLGMEEGETPIYVTVTEDYRGWMLFFFQSGKAAKVPLCAYETKQNRKKLVGAYSDKAELAALRELTEETELAVQTTNGRLLLVHTTQIPEKATRNTIGVAVISLKMGARIESVKAAADLELANPHRYRVRNLPAAGALLRAEDVAEQITL